MRLDKTYVTRTTQREGERTQNVHHLPFFCHISGSSLFPSRQREHDDGRNGISLHIAGHATANFIGQGKNRLTVSHRFQFSENFRCLVFGQGQLDLPLGKPPGTS